MALKNMFDAHAKIYRDFKEESMAEGRSAPIVTIAKSITPVRLTSTSCDSNECTYLQRIFHSALESFVLSPVVSLVEHVLHGAFFDLMLTGRLKMLGFDEEIEGIVGSIDVLGINHCEY